VAKHLIDLDDARPHAARAELGTTTIKDTVNEAPRRASSERQHRVTAALDLLAAAELDERARRVALSTWVVPAGSIA
jgi:Arc/MetJ family transcription regulator